MNTQPNQQITWEDRFLPLVFVILTFLWFLKNQDFESLIAFIGAAVACQGYFSWLRKQTPARFFTIGLGVFGLIVGLTLTIRDTNINWTILFPQLTSTDQAVQQIPSTSATYVPSNAPYVAEDSTPTPIETAVPVSGEPAPNPTQQAEPTLQLADAIVAIRSLNLREGPSIDYDVISSYPSGTPMKVLSRQSSGNWLRLQAPDGQIGWMSSEYLQINIALGRVVVAEAPPRPTSSLERPTVLQTSTSIPLPTNEPVTPTEDSALTATANTMATANAVTKTDFYNFQVVSDIDNTLTISFDYSYDGGAGETPFLSVAAFKGNGGRGSAIGVVCRGYQINVKKGIDSIKHSFTCFNSTPSESLETGVIVLRITTSNSIYYEESFSYQKTWPPGQ